MCDVWADELHSWFEFKKEVFLWMIHQTGRQRRGVVEMGAVQLRSTFVMCRYF